jgi:hypothetical protein
MISDKGRLADGLDTLVGGMDSGRSPSTLSPKQCSYAKNVTFRGGFAKTRPVFKRLKLTGDDVSTFLSGKFQGATWFTESDDHGYIVAVADGYIYQIEPPRTAAGWIVSDITNGARLSSSGDRVWMTQTKENQAKNYLIIQDGVHQPFIYDPLAGGRYSVAADSEVPIGTGPMAFGHGRLWVAQGANFVAGDIANGPNGVLKFTENDYVSGGGAFRVPLGSGDVTAMTFTHAPNTALGQGELVVFTSNGAVSVTVPADRYDWFASTDPLQRVVLINNGSMSQLSTELANGDVLFRSKDGIRTLVQAVRDFSQYGNTPISREVASVLRDDDHRYLRYTSGVLFDNRYLLTTNSSFNADKGIGFKGLVVLDFDLISSMSNKSQSAYDGYWQVDITRASTTVNIEWMQLITGMYHHRERCFGFGRGGSGGATEMWELLPDNSPAIFDEDYDTSGGGTDGEAITNKVTSEIETASYSFESPAAAKMLEGADLWIDEVTGGVVTFDVDFRPDQYPMWINWQDFSVNAKFQDCGDVEANCPDPPGGTGYDPQTYLSQYRPRLRIGAPPDTVEGATGLPFNYGWEFAARVRWTGSARLKMMRLNGRATQEEPYAEVDANDSAAKSIVVECENGETNTAAGV